MVKHTFVVVFCDKVYFYNISGHFPNLAYTLYRKTSLVDMGRDYQTVSRNVNITSYNLIVGYGIPENAHLWPEVLLNSKNSKWTCDKGYYKVDNKCEKVIVPQNASLDKSGHGWECNYKLKKNQRCLCANDERRNKGTK